MLGKFRMIFIHNIQRIISYEKSREISWQISYEISSDDEFIRNFIGNVIENDRGKFHMNEPSAPS